jgi:hypothetical protein
VGQSMESWGPRPAGRFELTSRTTATQTQADPISSCRFAAGAVFSLSVG